MVPALEISTSVSFLIAVVLGVGPAVGPRFVLAAIPSREADRLADAGEIRGVVRDAEGPVAGAVVRVQTTELAVRTNADGGFVITGSRVASGAATTPASATESAPDAFLLTAWAPGYYNAGPLVVRARDSDVTLMLERHTVIDNAQYNWVGATIQGEGKGHCQKCHSNPEAPDSLLFYDEWVRDAHSNAARNPLFLSMYRGTDLAGNKSPPTRFVIQRDYGRVPLPPDPARPYYGPGFKLDFPDQAGNCSACHAPAAATASPNGTDPQHVSGAGAEGVTCDLCHKVWDVRLDSATGLPVENMPGVMSMEFRRPGEKRQLFVGPLDDAAPGDDTASPVFRESRFCAPCHFASFWGVEVYGSYHEWLESPYNNPKGGRTCQDCHMPHRGATRFTREDQGGLARDPQTIGSHLMTGASEPSFLHDALTLDVTATRIDDAIEVSLSVTNANAGHHIPTDSPLRNILLVVSACDAAGNESPLTSGPTLPDWAGDLAGKPGRGYAKVLEELWTETAPSGAYWNPIRLLSDTRLPALATDSSHYRFAVAQGDAVVTARLIYRRAFQKLARQKGWDLPDIEVRQVQVPLPTR